MRTTFLLACSLPLRKESVIFTTTKKIIINNLAFKDHVEVMTSNIQSEFQIL